MQHIESKQEFYKYSRQLLLGNILTNWTFEEFEKLYKETPEVLPKVVGVRHVRKAFTNKGTSGLFKRDAAYKYGLDTPDKVNILYDEGAVHDRLTIQGEVMASPQGLYLRYSHLQCHQRALWAIDANGLVGLKRHQLPHNLPPGYPRGRGGAKNGYRGVVSHAFGLRASAILQKYMDTPSWECLNSILACQHGPVNSWNEPFPNFTWPIVEFASFSSSIGVLGWNSLVWEVRSCY